MVIEEVCGNPFLFLKISQQQCTMHIQVKSLRARERNDYCMIHTKVGSDVEVRSII